jgi:hypothetical protein
MKLATTALLARPTSPADRGRLWLLAGATAVAGGLLIAAARIARLSIDGDYDASWVGPGSATHGLAPYVQQAGLRPGVVLGALLMTVPVFALAVQALRVGSVARDRRMSALRLAGATPQDVRAVAAGEAGGAALLGGLLAGPAYLALYVMLGLLLPRGQRLLPTPSVADLLVWLLVVVGLGVLGVVVGGAVERRVLTDPLGVHRRVGAKPPGWPSMAVSAIGLVLVATGLGRINSDRSFLPPMLVVSGLLVTAFTLAPVVVRRRGRRLARRGSAADLLAGSRLAAEPRSAGRVAAVLAVCGVALGMEAGLLTDLSGQSDLSFYVTGYAMSAVGVLVAVVIAVLTLLVGAADQLLDARRPLASLAALGVDERTLLGVLRRQLSSTAVPAVVAGVIVGGVGSVAVQSGMNIHDIQLGGLDVGLMLAAALLGGGLVAVVCRVAAALLRSRLREAIDPENLRVA